MKQLVNKAYGRAEVQSYMGCEKVLQSAKAGSHCTSFCSNLYSAKRVVPQEGFDLKRSGQNQLYSHYLLLPPAYREVQNSYEV